MSPKGTRAEKTGLVRAGSHLTAAEGKRMRCAPAPGAYVPAGSIGASTAGRAGGGPVTSASKITSAQMA